MQDDRSDGNSNSGTEGPPPPPCARKHTVEMTFWTTHAKREVVRAIAFAHSRTLRSLLNEALDWLIAKYGQPRS